MVTAKLTDAELRAFKPSDFRNMVRKGKYTDATLQACQGYAQANLVILPKEYAFEFLLFCNRNPSPCPVLEVCEPGDPEPKQLAPGADLRTDLPRYRVYKDGELIDEPTDVTKYWRNDLVSFLLGCGASVAWSIRAANITWRMFGAYRTKVPCVPAGRFHGPMVLAFRAFRNTHDAVRAIQISSRYPLFHGPPFHIGDPAYIGVENFGQPDRFNPYRPVTEPPKPGEIVMGWGCGGTPQTVVMESKISLAITHAPSHMFVTDRLAEEMATL